MKKTTTFIVLLCLSTVLSFAQWQKMDLTLAGGGTINPNVNQLALDNGKLYAATADGIFESTSANGGDWTAFGLQGTRVFMMSFGVNKYALTAETAADNGTAKTLQLYKLNGATWELTNFNPGKLAVFGVALDNLINFAQINDGTNEVVVVPTWGNGIWRSVDGGANWTKSAYAPCAATPNSESYKKIPGIYSFPSDPTLYGTDKPTGDAYASDMQFVIYSTDFGITWNSYAVGNFFNPWAFHKRKVSGVDNFYWGGKDGNQGVVWTTTDMATGAWSSSLAVGVEYWDTRRIIGDDDGKLYAMCSEKNVYVSDDNGETFAPVGTGIVIPATIPRPANEPFFLTNMVKSASKLYVSTYNEGIYEYDLIASVPTVDANRLEIYQNASQNELYTIAESGSKIEIYSITGNLVKSTVASSKKTSISIATLQAGVYVVKVLVPSGSTLTNRFIKN